MIRLTRPSLGDEELHELERVLASGQLVQGPAVAAFETALAEALRVSPASVVACSTGTTALQLALAALSVGPGDEVVLPDFVFPSVASAVLYTGATPVVCDVDPESFNVDEGTIRAAVTERTRAVIAVHQFGVPCDVESLMNALPCPVIEDAACALGTRGATGFAGTQTGLGCFSFHPRKIITTGEGGAVIARDPAHATRLRHLRQHGMRFGTAGVDFPEVGYAARMSELHAAVGLAQMRKLDAIIAGRARAAAAYRVRLSRIDAVRTTRWTWHPDRVYQGLVVLLDAALDRTRVISGLRERGVESTIGTYAIHAQAGFQSVVRVSPGGLRGSRYAADHCLTLPLRPDMTDDDIDQVCAALGSVIPHAGASA